MGLYILQSPFCQFLFAIPNNFFPAMFNIGRENKKINFGSNVPLPHFPSGLLKEMWSLFKTERYSGLNTDIHCNLRLKIPPPFKVQ